MIVEISIINYAVYYTKEVSESLSRTNNPYGLYAATRAGVCTWYIRSSRKGTLLPLVLFGAKGSAKRHERGRFAHST